MSQPNNTYPPFNYNAEYFDAQSSHVSNASFPQWSLHGSRPVGNSAPSPSPSVQASRTAPNPRNSRLSWVPSMTQDSNIDPALPNVSLLAPPQAPRSRIPMEKVGSVDPIARFYDEAPWSSQNPRSFSVIAGRQYHPQPSMDFGSYREAPGSDLGSTTQRSDSGYFTHHAHSVISNDPDLVDRELPSDMTLQVNNLNVNSASSEQTDIFRVAGTDHTSPYSGRSTTQGKEFPCVHCKEVSKCKSDYKKHMLKHDKPFKCDMPNCRRGGKGFTTENDLVRHKKSVHRIGMLLNSWKCASPSCRHREKIWPRLDNFKQHINRMHRDEDEHDLIQRSAYQHRESSQASQTVSVAPMETQLAGIGTEKQFPGNEFEDPVSGLSLTPDQDTSHWTSLTMNSHDFAMDVDQTSPTEYSHDSRRDSRFRLQTQLEAIELRTGTAERNNNLKRLDTLAALASSQSPDQAVPPPPPQLSNAPQTKADQQRQALQKFSKIIVQDIKNSSNGENVDLEDVVMRLLSGATKPGKKEQLSSQGSPTDHMSPGSEGDTLTKGEALKASQAISALLKQSSRSSNGRSRPSPIKGFLLNKVTCGKCGITLARACDLRKHMKRHDRPYGCTYPKCHKRFGAKSDWKRHENSQHFQLESFRCSLGSPSSPCGELLYRHESFNVHLRTQHEMVDDEALANQVRTCRIGKNGQGQFWCGFCEKIVRLEKKRNAAWDERFDHIDRHFCKEKRGIEEWLCVEAKKKKGDVQREMNRDFFDEEEEDDFHEVSPEAYDKGGIQRGTSGDSAKAFDPQAHLHVPRPSTTAPERGTTPNTSMNTNPRKRPSSSTFHLSSIFTPADPPPPSPPPPKRTRREKVKYCCSCQSGPWAQHLYADCMSCNHHLCSRCTVVGGFEPS